MKDQLIANLPPVMSNNNEAFGQLYVNTESAEAIQRKEKEGWLAAKEKAIQKQQESSRQLSVDGDGEEE